MSDIYVVLIINLIIWSGLFFYIFNLNKSLFDLKKQFEAVIKKGDYNGNKNNQ